MSGGSAFANYAAINQAAQAETQQSDDSSEASSLCELQQLVEYIICRLVAKVGTKEATNWCRTMLEQYDGQNAARHHFQPKDLGSAAGEPASALQEYSSGQGLP